MHGKLLIQQSQHILTRMLEQFVQKYDEVESLKLVILIKKRKIQED